MVAVEHLDVNSGIGHAASDFAQLTRLGLIQALDQDFALFENADACGGESGASGGAVGEEEMADGAAVEETCATAFDADASAAERFTHFSERARAVFEFYRQIFHVLDAPNFFKCEKTIAPERQVCFNDGRTMDVNSMTRVAQLVGEAGRIRMLTMMLDGSGHSAAELAMAAEVSPQTASSHLSKMLSGGLIVSEALGRQRFFRLKNGDVARAIEALGALAQPLHTEGMPELRFARTCYDHLAGVLSIALRDELLKREVLRHRGDQFALAVGGEKFLREFGIQAGELRGLRRSFARKCLDWTERHHHVGGAVGAALLTRFFELKWIARTRSSRAVRVTHEGERQFEMRLGIRCAALRCG